MAQKIWTLQLATTYQVKLLNQKSIMRDLFMIKEIDDICKDVFLANDMNNLFHLENHGEPRSHQRWSMKMSEPSFEQNRYFILFIDDYARKTWLYFR